MTIAGIFTGIIKPITTTIGVVIQGITGGPHLDAFGRLRVSNTTTLFDSVQTYKLDSLFWNEITATSGTVTYVSNSNLGRLACTATNGSRAVLQTKNYIRYQPAKSQYIKCTSAFGSGTLHVVQRSSVGGTVSETRIDQADFDCDTIDGTGGSGFDLDTTKANIFTIDFQYLGVGYVRFGVVGSDGIPIQAHGIQNANNNDGLYMLTAMLPFRVEIVKESGTVYKRMGFFDDDDGLFWEVQTTGSDSMDFFCCSVESEEGQNTQEERGSPFAAGTQEKFDYSTTLQPVLSIRPKLTFEGKTNRAVIIPEFLSIISEAQAIRISVILNPSSLATGTGRSWTSVDGDSAVEYLSHNDVGASISGGNELREYRIDQSQGLDVSGAFLSRVGLSLHADGTTQDTLCICVQALEAANDCHVALNWKELF